MGNKVASSALFLDRDGVINVDHGYVHKAENFEFVDGIFDVCSAAQAMDYKIIVVTNQAGIGRGYYTEQQFGYLTQWMCAQFIQREIRISAVYHCPFHPVHGVGVYKRESDERKPNPGMLLRAAKDLGLDLRKSVMVGDKMTDMEAAFNAGVGMKVLFKGEGEQSQNTAHGLVDASIVDLRDVIKLLSAHLGLDEY